MAGHAIQYRWPAVWHRNCPALPPLEPPLGRTITTAVALV